MGDEAEKRQHPGDFVQKILPHIDAAYDLARWLTRNEQGHDAVLSGLEIDKRRVIIVLKYSHRVGNPFLAILSAFVTQIAR